MTIVFKISDNLKPSLIKFYKDLCLEKKPSYSVFQAKDADTTITLYESGKVMFQGISADIDANVWIDLEKKHNNRIIDIKTGKEKKIKEETTPRFNFDEFNTIGSDEVGTGDYFGPIVVTATFVSRDQVNFLHDLKITDSKKITDERIKEITPIIIDKVPYSTFILSPEAYNKNYSEDINMNKIKAILHNKVLLNMVDKTKNYDKIVVDQFVNPKKYYEYLETAPQKVKNITFTPKAEEQCLSVACASIISRYIFLSQMDKLSKELGATVPKGAGNNVDEYAKEIVKNFGFDKLNDIAKINFKNTKKIKEQ